MAEVISTCSVSDTSGNTSNGGAWYTNLTTWENARQGTLSEPEVVECYGEDFGGTDGALLDEFDVASWVTTPTNNIIIRAAAGNGHGGVYRRNGGSGFAVYTPNSTKSVITHRDGDLVIQGIEVFTSGVAVTAVKQNLNGPTTLELEDCLFDAIGICLDLNNTDYTSVLLRNCVVHCPTTVVALQGPTNCTIESCTASNELAAGRVFRGNASTLIRNCVARSLGDSYTGMTNPANSNNIDSGTSAPGSNSVNNVDLATPGLNLTDLANLDYTPVVGGAVDGSVNAGLDLSGTYTTDVAGNTRVAPWEMGAYELVSAGPTPAVLSLHTTPAFDATTATIGCTTDTAGGTLYWYLSQSNVAPTPEQLKAGTNAEQFGNLVPTLGANTVGLTGLTSSTEYWHYWIQETT